MLIIKSALLAVNKRWFFALLLLVQITYGLSTITGSANLYYNFYYLNHRSVLDLNSTHLIATEELDTRNFSNEQVEDIHNRLAHHEDVISHGTYYEEVVILDPDTSSLDSKMVAALTRTNTGLAQPIISGIVIDENYNQLLNLQVIEGRGFTGEDFKETRYDKTNVLVGSYFKSFFHIGDIIHTVNNNEYEIIGFLPDRYIVNNNSSNIYIKLNRAILIPMSKEIYHYEGSMGLRLQLTTILTLGANADIEDINQIIQLPESYATLYLKNLGKDVQQLIADSAYADIPALIIGFSFILFCIVGILTTTIVSIIIRKREFGIKLVLGESKQGLFGQIVLENFMIGITGMGLSLAYFAWKYSRLLQYSSESNMASPIDFKLNTTILFIVFLVLLVIMVIANAIVFGFMRKLEPKALIGGME